MPPLLAVLLFVSLPLGICIFLYVRSCFRLVKVLEERFPRTWRQLGKPHVIYVGAGPYSKSYYVTPAWPFLSWLVAGRTGELDEDAASLFHGTRRLFFAGIIGMLVWSVLFFLV